MFTIDIYYKTPKIQTEHTKHYQNRPHCTIYLPTCPESLQHPELLQHEVPHEQPLAKHPEASSVITLKGELPPLQMRLLLPQFP